MREPIHMDAFVEAALPKYRLKAGGTPSATLAKLPTDVQPISRETVLFPCLQDGIIVLDLISSIETGLLILLRVRVKIHKYY